MGVTLPVSRQPRPTGPTPLRRVHPHRGDGVATPIRRAWASALLVVAAAALVASSHANVRVERVAGTDRITTAIAASQAGWASADTVLLATAGDFPDALAAGAVAASRDAPLLLTHADGLAVEVAEEIARLAPDEAILLGGEGVLRPAVAADVAALGVAVERIAGADRFETAAAAARTVGAPQGEVAITLGTDFPDAVSAGALAAAPGQLPVLLTTTDALPAPTISVLEELDVARAHLVGGEAVIGAAVARDLAARGITVERHSGPNRYATSVAVAGEALARHDGPVPVVLATGQAFPDALAAGGLAASQGGVVLLTPPDGTDAAVTAFLRAHGGSWESVLVLGGRAAVSDAGLERLAAAVRGDAEEEPAVDLVFGIPDDAPEFWELGIGGLIPVPVPSVYMGERMYEDPERLTSGVHVRVTADVDHDALADWWMAQPYPDELDYDDWQVTEIEPFPGAPAGARLLHATLFIDEFSSGGVILIEPRGPGGVDVTLAMVSG